MWWWGAGGGGGAWGGAGGVDAGGGGGASLPFALQGLTGQDGLTYLPGGQDDAFYEPGVGVGGMMMPPPPSVSSVAGAGVVS